MPTGLKSSDYQELLESISRIYSSTQMNLKRQMNLILIATYWEIGRRIVTIEQKNDLRAQYGEALIERLSTDLNKRHGEGFSQMNIRRMRQFFTAFPIQPTLVDLEWSHYQALSKISDEKIRKFYLNQTVKNKWSVRDLTGVLKKDNVARETVSLPSPPGETKDSLTPVKLRMPAKGEFFTCILIESSVIKPTANKVLVDLGFNVKRRIKFEKVPKIDFKMIYQSVETSDGYSLKATDFKATQRYTYRALLEKVVDGDTLTVEIDLGFDNFSRQKLRLNCIDTPEIDKPEGIKARDYVKAALKDCEYLTIRTTKSDKYDRYLVDVWYGKEEKYLNQELLDVGLAKLYKD